MTAAERPRDEDLARERSRSAAALAALHDDLDAAAAERARLLEEIDALGVAREHERARAEAAEAEVAALRNTRAVRWATRLRAVLGR